VHRSSLSEALENQTLLRTKKVCVFLQTLSIHLEPGIKSCRENF